MNLWIGLGRITKDIELTYAKSNQNMAIAKYSIAVEEYVNKERKSQFFNIISFGKAAEFASKYFKKGKRVLVEGRVQLGEYTNKEGHKIKTFDIIATNQEFADGYEKAESKNDIPDTLDELPFE